VDIYDRIGGWLGEADGNATAIGGSAEAGSAS